jgi:hypothetical protein
VRVIERQDSRGDEHFTEGEPDLEPPEELAVLEIDEDALLEGELDNEAVLEDEVDLDVLEFSLDHLVHDGDSDSDRDSDDDGDDDEPGAGAGSSEDLEIEDLEDRAESLDRILREKLAGDEEAPGDTEEPVSAGPVATTEIEVSACGPDEFVCRSCFLVRSRTQAADSSDLVCHDCVA